jgi:CYTH domain-containing protein
MATEDKKRSFTVEKTSVGKPGGVYKGSPLAAAKKAASIRWRGAQGPKTADITVRETTRGSSHKEFEYKVERKKLAKPVESTIAGKKIVREYEVIAHAKK